MSRCWNGAAGDSRRARSCRRHRPGGPSGSSPAGPCPDRLASCTGACLRGRALCRADRGVSDARLWPRLQRLPDDAPGGLGCYGAEVVAGVLRGCAVVAEFGEVVDEVPELVGAGGDLALVDEGNAGPA